ncbi:GntR family transcriptional regulator [Ruicaihuangia caeni]|uniref:GntR family transcriptional regulator n=1 Tax=Ruicaihuangia caeni TaxID=3042517 RepID=A0AAW6T3F9_9MICO|nr:GntR family transcriptional regulator [Klugiella sp. YN-L-19]MDI2097636.1 GntR family transcriptional regulator [Klugiella sp. YN-L-19]
MDEDRPIFVQIAEQIENDILSGALEEESQVPSTNEFAAFHRINPATAGKGVNLLVDAGVLYKRRGIGMFVAAGARERIASERRARFADEFVTPLVAEARKLGIGDAQLITLIRDHTTKASAAQPLAQTSATKRTHTQEKSK